MCERDEYSGLDRIDPCIAPIIRALQEGGVPTATSCCGHNEKPGYIGLKDGRFLKIYPSDKEAWPSEHNCVRCGHELYRWEGVQIGTNKHVCGDLCEGRARLCSWRGR